MLQRYFQKLFGTKQATAHSTCQPCEAEYDYVTCHVEDQVIFDTLFSVHP